MIAMTPYRRVTASPPGLPLLDPSSISGFSGFLLAPRRMDTSMSSYSEDSYAQDIEPPPGRSGQYDPADWSATHAATRSSVIMVPNKPALTRRGGGRKPKNDKLPPEEEEKRRQRRERNKLAAAKCRQRRVDHANELQQEADVLETERRGLMEEVERLQRVKDQYAFVLQSHLAVCSCESLMTMSPHKATTDIMPSLSMRSGVSTSSLKADHCVIAAGVTNGAGGQQQRGRPAAAGPPSDSAAMTLGSGGTGTGRLGT